MFAHARSVMARPTAGQACGSVAVVYRITDVQSAGAMEFHGRE